MDVQKIKQRCRDILQKHVGITTETNIVVVYDTECQLARELLEGYKLALRGFRAKFVDYASVGESLKQELYALSEKDLVVLIQSTSFRTSSYRIRLDLNNRGIFCVEHAALALMAEDQMQTYLDTLTYDGEYYKRALQKMSSLLSTADRVMIECHDDSVLSYSGPFEPAKGNIGDFSVVKGTRLPVGEVFTEPVDLSQVQGKMSVNIIPDIDHRIHVVDPFVVTVKDGCIVSHTGPELFEALLEVVRSENEDAKIPLREMGFGLNRYISKKKPLNDVNSFERQMGFHVSLGMKHNMYRHKEKDKTQRYHIDIFLDVKKITIGDTVVYDQDRYLL